MRKARTSCGFDQVAAAERVAKKAPGGLPWAAATGNKLVTLEVFRVRSGAGSVADNIWSFGGPPDSSDRTNQLLLNLDSRSPRLVPVNQEIRR